MSEILPSLMGDLHWSLAFLKTCLLSCRSLSAHNNNNVVASVLTVLTSGSHTRAHTRRANANTLTLMLRCTKENVIFGLKHVRCSSFV